jgi:hypothetical protein
VSAGVTGGQYYTDWYGSVLLAHPPLNLTVRYEGSFTVSRTQTLYLWNWGTSLWDQINSGTVSTTDVIKTWTTGTPGSYVGPSREVRLRVKGNNRNSTYTSRGDQMAFEYDYTAGTAPQLVAGAVAAVPVAAPRGADHADREALAASQPLAALRRVEGAALPQGPRIVWSVGVNEHVDGFSVYREEADASLRFVGDDANVETANGEAIFRFVDRSGVSSGSYWLGARSCSGAEAMLGPITIEAAAAGTAPAFAVLANPVRGEARFELSMPEAGDVRLEVFDVQGRQVATPFAGRAPAGVTAAAWDLRGRDGSAVGPGVYFARVRALGQTLFSRVTVVDN